MTATFILVSCALSTLVWLAAMVQIERIKRATPVLGEPNTAYRGRRVSIIVPARNEERDIEVCLRSLLAQQGVELELIVVNDHSSDNTGRIIDAIAAEDSRVITIHNPKLIEGWFGKANAMQQAAKRASGEFLLFSDADIEHAPDVLWSTISEMERGAYDFMTLIPRFRVRTFWENTNITMYLFGLALMATTQLEHPDSDDAIAIGAFMLVRRAAFERIGGFSEIKNEMLDDVGLAQTIKARGYKIGIRQGMHKLALELFKNNLDALIGPTKNILMVGKGHAWVALPAAILSVPFLWSSIAAVIVGLSTGSLALIATGLMVYGLQYASFYLQRAFLDFDPFRLLFFPLVIVVVFTCTARALYYYYIRGEVMWRGRAIPHAHADKNKVGK